MRSADLGIDGREHDEEGAVLIPDHLPELVGISLFRSISHHKQFGSEV